MLAVRCSAASFNGLALGVVFRRLSKVVASIKICSRFVVLEMNFVSGVLTIRRDGCHA